MIIKLPSPGTTRLVARLILRGLAARLRAEGLAPDLRPGADSCEDGRCGLDGPGPTPRASKGLRVGDTIPDLAFRTHDGRPIAVPARSPGRAQVLYFMRSAGCSICRGHVRKLLGGIEDFRALGAEILIVHPGNDRASAGLASSLAASAPVASGRPSNAYEAVGLSGRGPWKGSGTLLVDDRGVVRHVRLASLPFLAFDEPGLMEALASLSSAHVRADRR